MIGAGVGIAVENVGGGDGVDHGCSSFGGLEVGLDGTVGEGVLRCEDCLASRGLSAAVEGDLGSGCRCD